MAISQVPSRPTTRIREVNRTAYPERIEKEMQKIIKEGSDFGAFMAEWHRLLGALSAMHLVLNCTDQTVRGWLRNGVQPHAVMRGNMRALTPKLGKLPNKAWAKMRAVDVAAYMQNL